MRLWRSNEGPATPTTDTDPTVADAWDGIPSKPAHEPLIKAPRAGDLVAAPRAA